MPYALSGSCSSSGDVSWKKKPLASHIRLLSGLSMGAALALSPLAVAQDPLRLEEVLVTAQKRSENLQDVPISINAMSSKQLEDLNIKNFEDYVLQVPSLSFTQRRPGEAQLFMRGISDGGNNNLSLQGPAVAVYLDEQPVTATGINLDVHIYDVERIEVLMGPQGTLYGAASESGNLKIITKKPQLSEFSAGFDVSAESIKHGDNGQMVEGFVNIPISDMAALRLVAWYDKDGGYIDAVADTITFPLSGITRTNEDYVKDDFNEATTKGARAALRVELNDSWSATASAIYQETNTDGIWDEDPEMDDYEVGRFFKDSQDDEWTKLGLVVEGDLGFADLTYAGSYLDRDFDVYSDYSHYSISGAVEPYYTCYVSYFGPCVDPSIQYRNDVTMDYQTHELRLMSKQDQKLRWIVGAFYMKNETKYDTQWAVPTINPGAAVRDDLYFETDQKRVDEEVALFGEITYDITDKLTGIVGYRWFDDKTTLKGFVGTVWWPNCCFTFGPRPPDNVNSKFDGSDHTEKVSLAYQLQEDVLVYATYAKGYLPGGANRTDQVGATFEPDFVDSYELGWKSTLLDGRWRLNGAIYYMEWDDMQLGFFNPDISLLGLVDNVGSAESKGVEIDTSFLVTENLELSASYAYNDASLTDDYFSRDGAESPDAKDGQDLPFTPDNKLTLTGRYSFDMQGYEPYAQVNYVYTDSMYNDLFLTIREKMGSYSLTNLAFGVNRNNWNAELYVDNATDEKAELYINTVDIQRLVTVNRPRTIGLRFGMRFD